jgi:peptide/nickel transport system substrate-binding protein
MVCALTEIHYSRKLRLATALPKTTMKALKQLAGLALASLGLGAGLAHAADIRVGFGLDALTMDPGNHRSRETETILRNMYDGLLTRDSKMKIVPELVASWKQLDATTYEFKLRQGVKFHSGDEMTAEDVKFTFDRIIKKGMIDGKSSPRAGLLGPLKDVVAVDKYTVQFKLEKPWAILPAMLPFQEVVSKAFVQKVGDNAMATQVDGTGPFKLVEWRRGESITMERFAGYYGGSPEIPPVGPAKADRVIFKIIPENSSRVAALLAGDVDIATEVPVHMMKQIESNPTSQVVKVRGTRSFFISLNNTKPPFDQLLVRKAANHALDKKLLIERVMQNTATPINGVLSPDAFSFDPGLPAYEYSPAKARQLLAQAGYPNGIDVTLDVEGSFADIAQAIGSLLTKAGIRTKVVVGEGTGLRTKWLQDKKKTGDMWLTSWGDGSLDPEDIFAPTLSTGDRGNSAGYSNTAVDGLLSAASTEADAGKRASLFTKAQRLVNADAPWIFLWVPQDIYGVSRRLKGWLPSADSRVNLHRAYIQ